METDVARVVIAWLIAEGWEVHEEVNLPGSHGVADIIAVRDVPGRSGPLLRRVEVKTSFSLDLVAQAVDAACRRAVHWVEVAYPVGPRNRRTSGRDLLTEVLRTHGVGELHVQMPDTIEPAGAVRRGLAPRLERIDRFPDPAQRRSSWLHQLRTSREYLTRHQNLVPAGTNRGGFWTPYKGTIHQIRRLIEARGEVTVAEIMQEVKHHYRLDSTARSCIPANLVQYEADWCHAEQRGGRWYFSLRQPGQPEGPVYETAPEEPQDDSLFADLGGYAGDAR